MLREFEEANVYEPDSVYLEQSVGRQSRELDRVPAVVDQALPFRSAPAAPDVPSSIGLLLFGAYFALIGALAIATAGPGESKFVITISALFVVAFFAVPRVIFAQEPKDAKRPSMDQFLVKGLKISTGDCSGRSALLQMLIVPVLLTFGMLLIALEIAFIG